MCHCRNKFLLLFLLVLIGYNAVAQTGSFSDPHNGKENNPYSKYGLGELRNGNIGLLRGMADITSAYYSPYQINSDNPASYSFLERTTFEVGMNAATRSVNGFINGTDQSYRTGTASVAYLSFAVPINKNGGFTFGFKPVSSIYYSLADSINTANGTSPIGMVIKAYEGSGALNYAYMGGSAKYKGLSIGFNAGYLFGNVDHNAYVVPRDTLSTNRAFNNYFLNNTRIGGVYWKGGLLYELKVDSLHMLRFGATITLGQNVKEHYSSFAYSWFNFGDTTIRDTAYSFPEQTGDLTLPMSYSAGIMFTRPGKWGAGIDYTATQWSDFKSQLNPNLTNNIGTESYKLSLGGEYTPDATNMRNVLSRTTYRMGTYYGTDYLKIGGTALQYYGLTAGFSMPFKRSLSQIHAAIDAGQFGTTENNLTKHNYLRFTFGVSLNDLWFIKRKEQ